MAAIFTAAALVPTGLVAPDATHRSAVVQVFGFVWGYHKDANGYGRGGECALAIVQFDGEGQIDAIPVKWLGRMPFNAA